MFMNLYSASKNKKPLFLFFINIIPLNFLIYDKYITLDTTNLSQDLKKLNLDIQINLNIPFLLFLSLIVFLSLIFTENADSDVFYKFLKIFLISYVSISTIFYLFRIYISRIDFIFSILLLTLFWLILLKLNGNLILLFSPFLLLLFYSLPINEIYSEYKFNTEFNECINFHSTDQKQHGDSIYIIGHGYGSFETKGDALSTNLLRFFEREQDTKNAFAVFTGDIAHTGNLKNYNLAKNQILEHFNDFLTVFEKDLFVEEFSGFSIIAANLSNSRWEVRDLDKQIINNFLNNTSNQLIFFFSHQLFWLEDVNGEPMINGKHLLEYPLRKNSLSWMNLNGKKLIVISGDSGGALNAKPFCEVANDGVVYIANGIGDVPTDTVLKINYDKNLKLFNLNRIELNNK